MPSPQIAISQNGRVSLWCDGLRRYPNGRISFNVINGDWRGSIKDGVVRVNYTKKDYPGEVVWEGKAPFHPWKYNEAIRWIEEQLKV